MKFFTNKNFLFKLIVSLCICLTLFNFLKSSVVQAESPVTAVGGKLLDPICALIVTIGDGMMEIIHTTIMGTNATAIFDNTNDNWLRILVAVIIATLAVVAAIIAVVATGGAALGPILTAIAKVAIKIGAIIVIDNLVTGGAITGSVIGITAEYFGDYVVFPTYTIGPEEIFSGKILLFDPNIFNPKEIKTKETTDEDGETVTVYYYVEDGEEIATSINNSAQDLKETVSKWYYIIRNIAIIGMIPVLLYVGIRILLTSIASEKAKYKQMLSDWLIAICLIFLMQYIMVFANSFVESITKILSSVASSNVEGIVIEEANDKLVNAIKELETDEIQYVYDDNKIVWPSNLMGQIRFGSQQRDGTTAYVGFTLCYFVLVIYTVVFTFTYIKRLLYLLFLTIIAPFVALTYPLDKIRDGQAQAFNMWTKEYIINLLIQPFHLLLYTVFVSMAYDLAGKNIIYSLVVIGFMVPAEKFLRTMFGFNKASSPGLLSGAAGAAMTISAVQSLAKFAGRGPGAKGNGGKDKSSNSGDDEKTGIRSADSGNSTQSLMESAIGMGDDNGSSNSRGSNNSNSPTDSDNNEDDPRQKMLDAYDDQYGTDEWDAEERDAMARELSNENPGSLYDDMSDEERINQLMDNTGYSREEAAEMLGIDLGNSDDVPNPQQRIFEPQNPLSQGKASSHNGVFKQTKGYLSARLQNFGERNFNKKRMAELAKKGLRTATTVGIGATGAAIGIAAGIASGSPGDVFKYGVSGAYAGSSIGQGISNKVDASIEKEKKAHEEAEKRQYGSDEYERRKNKKLDEQFKKDRAMRRLYSEKFNNVKGKELDRIMDTANEYRKYGITDNTAIIRAMNLNPNKRDDIQSIAAAKMAQSVKSEKDLESMMKRFGKTGANERQQREMERRIRKINKETLN